jgi:hypothetical protein
MVVFAVGMCRRMMGRRGRPLQGSARALKEEPMGATNGAELASLTSRQDVSCGSRR